MKAKHFKMSRRALQSSALFRRHLPESVTSSMGHHDVPDTMRAVTQIGYGAAEDSLRFARVPTPKIDSHEILVRVKAAGLNQIDAKLRYGYGKSVLAAPCEKDPLSAQKAPPFIVGRDFSGEVVQKGPNVPQRRAFQLGSSVMGHIGQLSEQGSWSEYVRVPYWNVCEKPEYLSFEEASSLPFSMTGATELLNKYSQNGENQKNDKIMILGGSSASSVSSLLSLMFLSQGVDPIVVPMSKDTEFLEATKATVSSPILDTNYKSLILECCSANAVFMPSGIPEIERFHGTLGVTMMQSRSIAQMNMLEVPDVTLQFYLLSSATLEISEMFARGLGYAYRQGEDTPTAFHHKHHAETIGIDKKIHYGFKFHPVDSPQLSVYPSYCAQRAYHLGMRKMLDQIKSYLDIRSTLPNMCKLDTIYPFSQALDAHKQMDSGEFHGKIVVSFDELWKSDYSDNLSYRDIDELDSYFVPSDTLVQFLRSGREGRAKYIPL